MKSILAMLIIITMTSGAGFTEKPCNSVSQLEYKKKCVDISCFSNYIPRLDMQGSNHTIFEGNVQFFNGNLLVEVFFTDIQTDGLTNRDNSKSCLETKFVRYSSQNVIFQTDYTGTVISTFEIESQFRKYIFVIDQSEFDTLLIRDLSDPKTITYNGYFGLLFLVVDEVNAAYYFNFSVEQDTEESKSVYTSFNSFLQYVGGITCKSRTDQCIQTADNTVSICRAPGDCTSTRTEVYRNLRYSLLQTITEPGFEDLYLIPVSVRYTGLDLNRQGKIWSSTITQKSTEIVLLIDFTYDYPLTIQVSSVLSSNQGQWFHHIGSVISGALAYQEIQANVNEQPDNVICNFSGICTSKVSTTLAFCRAPGQCKIQADTNKFFLGQYYSLLQTITEPGFEDFYLIPKSVRYTGRGLNRLSYIESSKMVPGSTEIKLKFEFVYSDVTIQVQSVVSSRNESAISRVEANQKTDTINIHNLLPITSSNSSNPSGIFISVISESEITLVFCITPGNCTTTTTTMMLQLNKSFSLLQTITKPGFEIYYLIPDQVTFSGDGLQINAKIISSTMIPGQTEIQTSMEYAYSGPVRITVQSLPSTVLMNETVLEKAFAIHSSINATMESYETIVVSIVLLILF